MRISRKLLRWIKCVPVLGLLLGSGASWAGTINVDASMSNQTFEGWGTSLAWFANSVGSWSNRTSQKDLVDALFSPETGLGLTYLRYDIGGGDDPLCGTLNHTGCITPADHATPGYLDSADGRYDWSRDASQRWVAKQAQGLGANLFEATSYSPPYWMTISGTSKGGVNGTENLASGYYGTERGSFADYLSTVVQHFSDSFGITFHHVEPLNESGQTWWTSTDTKQEGCAFSLAHQQEIIQDLHSALTAKGLRTEVAGMDEYQEGTLNATPKSAAYEFYSYEPSVKAAMTALNTHSYASSLGSVALATSGLASGKRVTVSEWGSGDTTGKDLSNQILADIYLTRPTAWTIWQPEYPGLMRINYANQSFTLNEAYYVFENYARFIRPGFQFIAISDPQSLAAFDQRSGTLVIVVQNWTSGSRTVTYQLSNFTSVGATAAVYRNSATEHLVPLENVAVTNGSFTYTANPGSVTTFVIRDTSYAPSAVAVESVKPGDQHHGLQFHGNWKENAQEDASGQEGLSSNTADDSYTVQFTGQQARVYGAMTPDGGIAAFSVDEGAETYFDSYAAHPAHNVFLFATPTLASGPHTLKVRVTGLKNPASANDQIFVRRVEIVSGSSVGQGIYRIVSASNGLDLEVNSASLADGATVDTYADVSGAQNEHWNVMAVGDGSYRIVNVNSGLDLEVNGASKANGGIVNQWQDSGPGALNEHWRLIPVGDGSYKIENVNSGLNLEINATSRRIDQWGSVSGAKNEHWMLKMAQ